MSDFTMQGNRPAGRDRLLLVGRHLDLFADVFDAIRLRFDVVVADNATTALAEIRNGQCMAALVDMALPDGQGWELVKALCKDDGATERSLPVLLIYHDDLFAGLVGSEDEHRICDAAVRAPFEAGVFLHALWKVCDIAIEQRSSGLNYVQTSLLRTARRTIYKLFDMATEKGVVCPVLSRECAEAIVAAARSDDLGGLLTALRDHHSYSFCHSLRVAGLLTVFGREVGMRHDDLILLAQGGILHDVGKAHVPVGLLDKPTMLTDAEMEDMKRHVDHSGRILRATPGIPEEVIYMAERHHERMDGSGYPGGLRGRELDNLSLLTALIDVYSALTDKRAYKSAFSQARALSIMEGMAGNHLEPSFLYRFKEMILDGVVS